MTPRPFDEKRYQTARALLAMRGVVMLRSDARDGAVRVLVEHAGTWHELRTPDDVEAAIASKSGVAS